MPFPPEKQLFTTQEAAEYTGRSARTLEKRRVCGQAPAFFKIHQRVQYRRADLDAYIAGEDDFVQGYVTSNEIVEKIVAAAPRLTDEQRRRLVGVLGGSAA